MTKSAARVSINGGGFSAEIASLGGELTALRDAGGRDYLWNGDPAFWTGRSPLLFPIVGRLAGDRLVIAGKARPMSQHGFARRSPFTIETREKDRCALLLDAQEATLAAYPFRFRLRIAYALAPTEDGVALTMQAQIENRDIAPMPCSFGFHPALRWPLPGAADRAGHSLIFDRDEPAPIHRLDDGFLDATQPSPVVARRIKLDDDLLSPSALVFTDLRSRGLTFEGPQGQRLRIDFPDMPHLGLWTKPGAGFLCIEPWQGYADRADFAGDFFEKPGLVVLAPGEMRAFSMTITILA